MFHPSKPLAVLALAVSLAGCTDNPRPTKQPTTRTSDAALRDPFGNWSNVDTDISGGHTGDLDKGALRRDVDRVLMK